MSDGLTELPDKPVVAVAGANGTGKSKLLACILAPWTSTAPTARDGVNARIAVTLQLTDPERIAIADLSLKTGWGSLEVPEEIVIGYNSSVAGVSHDSIPQAPALHEFPRMEILLKTQRSLNLVYLPAERRLLPTSNSGIDLDQLSETASYQRTNESRSSVQNFGRLDDQEFERFAAALSIADQLPEDEEQPPPTAATETPLPRISWEEFSSTVNDLIYPKKLLPLLKNFPEKLRIRLPSGETHYVHDLSSGERQALIIISRVLRAGAGHSVVIIDEPDAYLHPQLSERLITALSKAVGDEGQLIVATHSPAILDNLPLESILRVSHGQPVRKVGEESDRISLYRDTGFRASALTQSDLLLYTEGDSDGLLLRTIYPKLAKASITAGGGRTGVINRIKTLSGDGLPILGVVDRDVAPPEFSDPGVSDSIVVWPAADIEGVFLSDDTVLQIMIDKKLVKDEYRDINTLRFKRDEMYLQFKDAVIAEAAKNELRRTHALKWPNSRAANPVSALEEFASSISAPSREIIDSALKIGLELWIANQEKPWAVVRGKYLIGTFNDRYGTMRSYSSLLEAIAAEKPSISGFSDRCRLRNHKRTG